MQPNRWDQRTLDIIRNGSVVEGDCRIWKGRSRYDGYGYINVLGRRYVIHKVVYAIVHGVPIEEQDFICHTCDRKACTNEDHLVNKDAQWNTEDYARKFGMAQSKLTSEQVKAIRESYKLPPYPTIEFLANRYSVTTNSISQILHRRSYKYVE